MFEILNNKNDNINLNNDIIVIIDEYAYMRLDETQYLHFYYISETYKLDIPIIYQYDYGYGTRQYILIYNNGIFYSKEFLFGHTLNLLSSYCDCIRCSSKCIIKYFDFVWVGIDYDCIKKYKFKHNTYNINIINQQFLDHMWYRYIQDNTYNLN